MAKKPEDKQQKQWCNKFNKTLKMVHVKKKKIKRKIPLSEVGREEIFLHWAKVECSSLLLQTLFSSTHFLEGKQFCNL